MAEDINETQLKNMSKSKFGKHPVMQPNPVLAFFEKHFFKSTPVRAYLNGGITVGVFFYWWQTKNALPLYIWIGYITALSILAAIYWAFERRRLQAEIDRCEQELQSISKEIKERKKYFDNLKNQVNNENKS